MNKLQLALLTQWAEDARLEGIQGRKRMQKVIYFLKQAGCPIDAEYTLHHFGPYSRDVAHVTDTMVAERLLCERSSDETGNRQYQYTLGPQTRSMIDRTQKNDAIRAYESFRNLAVELLEEDPWLLELGSTILYFYRSHSPEDWQEALRLACDYKDADPIAERSRAALALAQRFAAMAK